MALAMNLVIALIRSSDFSYSFNNEGNWENEFLFYNKQWQTESLKDVGFT